MARFVKATHVPAPASAPQSSQKLQNHRIPPLFGPELAPKSPPRPPVSRLPEAAAAARVTDCNTPMGARIGPVKNLNTGWGCHAFGGRP